MTRYMRYICIAIMVAASQVSAAKNRAIVTTPPLVQRQIGATDFIGFSQTGNTFHQVGCGDAAWSTSGSYGNCCNPSYTDCLIATGCMSGTILYPSNAKYDCGATLPFCDNGLVGDSYDPLVSTNKPPSISLFWCRKDSATSWTVWRTVQNAVNVGSSNEPTLVVSRASITLSSTGSSINSQGTDNSPPTAGVTITGPSATSSALSSESSTSSNGNLSVGGLVGVIVSVICSVLGLLFGIGFKIWQHRKEQKKKKKESQVQETQEVSGDKPANEKV